VGDPVKVTSLSWREGGNKIDLDDLNKIRQCLRVARDQINSKRILNLGLIMEALAESLEIVELEITEKEHNDGSGKERPIF